MTERTLAEISLRVIDPKADPDTSRRQAARLTLWANEDVFPAPYRVTNPGRGKSRTYNETFMLLAAIAVEIGELNRSLDDARKILERTLPLIRQNSKALTEEGYDYHAIYLLTVHMPDCSVSLIKTGEDYQGLHRDLSIRSRFYAVNLTNLVHRIRSTKQIENVMRREAELRRQRSEKRRGKDQGPVEPPFLETVQREGAAVA